MEKEKKLQNAVLEMKDRFGEFPEEVSNLFYVVKIRNAGSSIGFEKVIIKNGIMICFFISNPMSPYYKSKQFSSVLERVGQNPGLYNLKQVENKLKILCRNVNSLGDAHLLLKKLYKN